MKLVYNCPVCQREYAEEIKKRNGEDFDTTSIFTECECGTDFYADISFDVDEDVHVTIDSITVDDIDKTSEYIKAGGYDDFGCPKCKKTFTLNYNKRDFSGETSGFEIELEETFKCCGDKIYVEATAELDLDIREYTVSYSDVVTEATCSECYKEGIEYKIINGKLVCPNCLPVVLDCLNNQLSLNL